VANSAPSCAGAQGPARVALVHDYLNQRGGAERVFAHIARAYPEAPIYTALFDRAQTDDLVDAARVRTSALQRIPLAQRYFRYLAPFYPSAFERFDLSSYDLVVSSTTAWAKGVITRPGATHVCYINTVSRFAFDYERYVGGFGIGMLARPVVAELVAWDLRAAQRPTAFIANSHNVAKRIERYYGRNAFVLPCPVDIDRFSVGPGGGDYFLVVSRLLPYKRIDRAIAACALANVKLLVVGTGPAQAALEQAAHGTKTVFCGGLSDAELRRTMGAARAVIVPAEEDFGLVPIEANACGRPAIALGRGGALETIRPGITGEHFAEPTSESLAAILRDFDPGRYDAAALRAHAEAFAPDRFIERLRALVDSVRAGARPVADASLLVAGERS
jgi:glycosyltransferase involved in cell wall biosynthesis